MPSFIPDGIFYPSLCHYPTIRRSCAPPIQPSNLSTAGCEPSVFSSHSHILRSLIPALLIHLLKIQVLSSASSCKPFFRVPLTPSAGLIPCPAYSSAKKPSPVLGRFLQAPFSSYHPFAKNPGPSLENFCKPQASGRRRSGQGRNQRAAARCGGSAAGPAARPTLPPAFALRQKDAERPFSVSPASLRLGLFTCSSPDRPPQRRLRSRPPWGCCPYR